MLNFIKKVKDKENGNATDDALKLIVKISEGSVRDAWSLLDRGLINSSMYLMNGNWVDGHKIHYKEVADAQVVFK